jgi:hypothetical protein
MKVSVPADFPSRRGSRAVILAQKLVVQTTRQDSEDLYWVLWVLPMHGLRAHTNGGYQRVPTARQVCAG